MAGSGGRAASPARGSGQLSAGRSSSWRRIDCERAGFNSARGAADAAGRHVEPAGSTTADWAGMGGLTVDLTGLERRAAGRGRPGADEGLLAATDLVSPVTEATSVPHAGHESRPPETSAPQEGQAIGFLGNAQHLYDLPPAWSGGSGATAWHAPGGFHHSPDGPPPGTTSRSSRATLRGRRRRSGQPPNRSRTGASSRPSPARR
jgi:hypothetical protein